MIENLKGFAMLVVLLGVLPGFLGVLIIQAYSVDIVRAQADKSAAQEKTPSPANNYLFSETTPSGDWLAQAEFDMFQTTDPNTPVVIAAIRSYIGKGDFRKHLMIESVVLKNRTAKAIRGFKLGWIIITEEDRKAGKNREAALTEGTTGLLFSDVEAQGSKRVEPFYIEFLKKAKPLIKNGALSGTLFIRIRVSEIHFEDGSIWRED